jgi:DNA ligase-1
VTSSGQEAKRFYRQALKKGHEGIVAKSLEGRYELGRRGKAWIKVKEALTIDVVVIAAERGHGRRSRWYSNFHLGVKSGDGFAMVGKTFKGLTDSEFDDLTARLRRLMLEDHGFWISVKPELVLEVAFNEIQRSPKYESGMALRFARVTRIRDDKDPGDVETLEGLKALFEKQFGSKARSLK